MRSLAKGKFFFEVKLDSDDETPVFSEAFLYDSVGRDDARFILGVAEEYDHLIRLFGEELTRNLLTARFSMRGKGQFRQRVIEALAEEGIE